MTILDSGESWPHQPVLYHEVLEILRPHDKDHYVDATLGTGGHAAGILEASAPDGKLLGIDRDAQAIEIAERRLVPFQRRVIIRKGNYTQIGEFLKKIGWKGMDGIIFDLGVSSMQLETPGRGFSFLRDEALDMRFDQQKGITAEEIVNKTKEADLARIIWEYGQEKQSRRIAAAIYRARPVRSTYQLASIVAEALKGPRHHIHPATRTFQALRMAVNEELSVLQQGLEQASFYLIKGGRMLVISFHSLEDRIVKQFFRHESQDCICPPEQMTCQCGHKASLKIITKNPIRPSEEEVINNPRARSARLRAAEKIA